MSCDPCHDDFDACDDGDAHHYFDACDDGDALELESDPKLRCHLCHDFCGVLCDAHPILISHEY